MAKPCRYQLPGEDKWMSESEFKKALNDGLIDKYIGEGTIAIRNFKPRAQAAPVVETPVVEAPIAPVSETKTETPKAETTLSPRAESFKNFYVDGYFEIPKRNTKQRSAKQQYISGQQSSLDPEDREAAKAALEEIERRESETTTKAETITPVAETKTEAPVAEVKEVKIPKNKKEREDAALKGTMVYHTLFDAVIESTPEQYEAALKEKAETGSVEDITKYGKEISTRQAPDPVLHGYGQSFLRMSQQDAQDELDYREKENKGLIAPMAKRATVAESKTEKPKAKSVAFKKAKSFNELENHPLVDSVEREYNPGAFDGTDYTYWVYLKPGYKFDTLDTTQLQEGSKKDLLAAFNSSTIIKTETQAEPTQAKESEAEYKKEEAPKKMVAPGRTKQAFDRNFTIEISADGKTATVQGEAIETADGRKLTPPKETAKITTNINGERVAITSKGDTVYLDRAKEVEVKEVKTEGKTPKQIIDEYIEIAKQSNGDYAIVYSRTNEPLVHKLNRATGRWQALNGKGEWADANDSRNAQANDAVNYTRKDKKEVNLNGEKFYFDFKNNSWKKYSESDGSLSAISKDEANKVQKEFVDKNPKRAPKSKEEVKQVINDIIDGAKFDTKNLAMSSLIPPKLWNEILDLVKEALFKGVDLTFALNDAARTVFDKAVKSGQITDKQAADFMDEVNSDKVTRESGLSSIKNDMASETAKKIASIGIENATIQEIIDSAEQAIKNGEIDPNFLVKQLIKDPRPTTPLETAVLIYSKTKMLNDLDDLYRQLNDTNSDADTSALREKIEILESDLLQHEVATSISGSQQGLSFSLRRIMMNSEYGLFLPRIQKIYNDAGKEMPEGLKEEIEKAQKELRRLNREIENKRKQADEAKDDEAVENIKNNKSKKASGKKSLSKDGKVAVSIDSIRKAVSEGAKTIEEVIEAVRKEVTSKYPDATDRQIRDAISNYGREVSKTKDDLSDEVNRIRSVGRMISKLEDIQKQLATKVGKIKNESVRTRAVKILTDRERELRRAIKEAMADIPVTEEELKAFQENKLEAYKKSLNDRNKELERRIREGDFSTKNRTKAFELDEEARKLEIERQALIEQFEYEKMRAQLAVEPDLQKIGRRLLDVFNLPKGLIASIDLSAPFRQGVIGVMSQSPIKTARQIKQMMGFWKNPETYDKWLSELKSSEFYPLIKASGLHVTEQNGKLSAMEEQFMNNLGNKIPIIGQSYTVGGVKVPGANLYKKSEVAYTGFLNNMRVQSFMEGADLLKEQGYTMAANPQVFKDWAKFCNSATGRGDMNPQLAVGLSPVFFSPRLIKARLEVLGLSPLYYSRMNPAARAMALKTMGRFMASTSLIIGMAALYYNNDDDDKTSVDVDPRSTDFGKIKLGNTRVDITGGMAVYYRTLAQFASGQKKSPNTGRIEDLNQGFGKTTRKDVGEQFFANKLAPLPSKFYQWASLTEKEKANRIAEEAGEDNAFNRMGIPVSAQDLLIPLWMRDVEPIMKEQGYGVGSALIGLSILGEGVQYYENKYKASQSSNSMNFDFNDSEGFGNFNDAGGFGDFKEQKGIGDFN